MQQITDRSIKQGEASTALACPARAGHRRRRSGGDGHEEAAQ
jgi:hypothetical protein